MPQQFQLSGRSKKAWPETIRESISSNKVWTEEEDRLFSKNLDKIIGGNSWAEILALFPGRSKTAIRTRAYGKRKNDAHGSRSESGQQEQDVPKEVETALDEYHTNQERKKGGENGTKGIVDVKAKPKVKAEGNQHSINSGVSNNYASKNAPEIIDLIDSDNESEPAFKASSSNSPADSKQSGVVGLASPVSSSEVSWNIHFPKNSSMNASAKPVEARASIHAPAHKDGRPIPPPIRFN
jgi:hypothetical protein